MLSITFHGGVKDIGGNKFLVDDKGTKIFTDFGMSFSTTNQVLFPICTTKNIKQS